MLFIGTSLPQWLSAEHISALLHLSSTVNSSDLGVYLKFFLCAPPPCLHSNPRVDYYFIFYFFASRLLALSAESYHGFLAEISLVPQELHHHYHHSAVTPSPAPQHPFIGECLCACVSVEVTFQLAALFFYLKNSFMMLVHFQKCFPITFPVSMLNETKFFQDSASHTHLNFVLFPFNPPL